MPLDRVLMGVLRDVGWGDVTLDEYVSQWYRDKLVDLTLHEPMLVDTLGPRVILTDAGRAMLRTELPSEDAK